MVKESDKVFKGHSDYKVPSHLEHFLDIKIRLGDISDAKECFVLNSQLGYQSKESDFVNRFSFLINHPEHSIIIAKNNNSEIIAWMHMGLRFLLEDNHFAQLAGLVVREKERSFGIGSHLLKVAEDWARFHGMKQICLSSSIKREKAHQFYLRNGYEHSKTSKLFAKEV